MSFSPTCAALNHLLKQNSWAMPRLARFAGKTARFDITPFFYAYTILDNGLLSSAEATASVDALCVLTPLLLVRLGLHDENAHNEIHSEGDDALLTEIFFLSRNLRWDVAEDLSHVTGDIAAEHIVQTVQGMQQQSREALENFSRAAAEYWTEEGPLLAKPQHVTTFIQQVNTLRDDVARLEIRINRLLAAHKN